MYFIGIFFNEIKLKVMCLPMCRPSEIILGFVVIVISHGVVAFAVPIKVFAADMTGSCCIEPYFVT